MAPHASFTWTPTSQKKKRDVTFTSTSTNMVQGACGAQWAWNFGDSSGGSNLPNPIYQWQNAGTYTVTLLVSNSAGSDSVQHTIVITNN
jgi:PKD repeat protein